MTKRPHANLIHKWADGAIIQVLDQQGQWKDDDNPTWHPKEIYRVKQLAWRQDLIDHIRQGGTVEYSLLGSVWTKAETLHCYVENNTNEYDWAHYACYRKGLLDWQQRLVDQIRLGNQVEVLVDQVWRPATVLHGYVTTDDIYSYVWFTEKAYRVKLEQWQQDLINYIKLGKAVEVKNSNAWQPADELVSHLMTNKPYQWKTKDSYRVKPEQLYQWAYLLNNEWCIASKLLSETQAQDQLAMIPGVEKIQKLSTFTNQ